jgi:hypothetical protein
MTALGSSSTTLARRRRTTTRSRLRLASENGAREKKPNASENGTQQTHHPTSINRE